MEWTTCPSCEQRFIAKSTDDDMCPLCGAHLDEVAAKSRGAPSAKAPHVRRSLRISLLLVLLVSAALVVGFFVWPTPYSHETIVMGRFSGGRFVGFDLLFSEEVTESMKRMPAVTTRVRKSRWDKTVLYDTWLSAEDRRAGRSQWLASEGVWIARIPYATGTMRTRPIRLSWPPDLRTDIECAAYGPLRVRFLEQSWSGIRAGSHVGLRDEPGEEAVVMRDLASLDVRLEVANGSSGDVDLHSLFYLASDGVLLGEMPLIQDEDTEAAAEMLREVRITAQQSRAVVMKSTTVNLTDLEDARDLSLVHLEYGWRLQVAGLPSRAELFKPRE